MKALATTKIEISSKFQPADHAPLKKLVRHYTRVDHLQKFFRWLPKRYALQKLTIRIWRIIDLWRL